MRRHTGDGQPTADGSALRTAGRREVEPQRASNGPRVGVAVAGGGSLAAAHFGVLEALEEAGIAVHTVAGVSAGALVAVLWAAGKRWGDLMRLPEPRLSSLFDVSPGGFFLPWRPCGAPGMFHGRKLERFCAQVCDCRELTELRRPCGVIAADLAAGQGVVFANRQATAPLPTEPAVARRFRWIVGGPTARVLRGAMAIPIVFSPVAYDDLLLADGGLVDHVPAWAARALGADYVIGVDLTSWPRPAGRLSTIGVASRALKLSRLSIRVGDPADLLISPVFPYEASILRLQDSQRHWRVGYDAARAALTRLRTALARPVSAPPGDVAGYS